MAGEDRPAVALSTGGGDPNMIEESLSRATPATRNGAWYRAPMKRAMDVTVSLTVLILLSPLFALIAAAIRRDSPGPAFYRGERVGRCGKVFKILKFRTMYETPASYSGPKVTAQDDPRVTPLGRWLRSTKLNELPQFWNVLMGEMSLVGPRPEDPTLAQSWPAAVREEILSFSIAMRSHGCAPRTCSGSTRKSCAQTRCGWISYTCGTARSGWI
jgi:lipopolysaccharide/colanic/teichoic acid biosynthesis glycosyltransferase